MPRGTAVLGNDHPECQVALFELFSLDLCSTGGSVEWMDGAHKFKTLDAMRGIAALVVAASHLNLILPGYYLAVDLFFILSGFVIAHSYEQRIIHGMMTAAEFIKLRLIRLYPLFLVGIAIGIATFDFSGIGAIRALTMIISRILFLPFPPSGSSNGYFAFDGPTWSLFFELVANLFYALIARYLSNRVILFIIGISLALLAYVSLRVGNVSVGWFGRPLNFLGGFPRVCLGFFIGVWIYRIYKLNYFNIAINPLILIAAIVILLDIPVALGWIRILFDLMLITIAFPILILMASQNDLAPHHVALQGVGIASYGIYVLHGPIFGIIQPDSLLAKIIALGCLTILAAILNTIYDEPARRWLRIKLKFIAIAKSCAP